MIKTEAPARTDRVAVVLRREEVLHLTILQKRGPHRVVLIRSNKRHTEQKRPARFERAATFRESFPIVWYVLKDIEREDEVESTVTKAQPGEIFVPDAVSVALPVGDGGAEKFTTDQMWMSFGQHLIEWCHLLGYVDTCVTAWLAQRVKNMDCRPHPVVEAAARAEQSFPPVRHGDTINDKSILKGCEKIDFASADITVTIYVEVHAVWRQEASFIGSDRSVGIPLTLNMLLVRVERGDLRNSKGDIFQPKRLKRAGTTQEKRKTILKTLVVPGFEAVEACADGFTI